VTAADLEDLAARFRACAIPFEEWTHTAHLRVGAWHVERFGAEGALPLLRQGIRKLNAHHGTPNSTTRGYHETVTVAYVRLIAELLPSLGAHVPLANRVATLVAGPVGQRDILLRFWSRDALMSARARAEWVPPDLAPLRVPAA
jgi:hypothetical protein